MGTVDHNSKVIKLLGEPVAVWRHFESLAKIPRQSGNEAGVLAFLRSFAADRGLSCESDAAGNTVIRRPGSGGGESAPTVVLQNHVDMVCVKGPSSRHDFVADPIQLVIDGGWGGDWLTANDTTLGSDNGLGAAMALSVLESAADARLPPLEALFTVDEETGLTGVQKLDPSLVTGRTLLNLDTEQWGEVCVGCAGTGTSEIRLPVTRCSPDGLASAGLDVCLEVEVIGLLGGHSGVDIKRDRANAIKLLVRAVEAARKAAPGALLTDFSGGDLRNSIPKHAKAQMLLEKQSLQAVEARLEECSVDFATEYGVIEKGLSLGWRLRGQVSSQPEEAGVPSAHTAALAPLDEDSTRRLSRLLTCLPHGVQKYSHSIEGLPETSCNLAIARSYKDEGTGEEGFLVTTSTRSSVSAAMEAVRDQMAAVAALCGAAMISKPAYSGWQPSLESLVLKVTRSSYQEVLGGQEPVVKACHAGLECGVLCGLLPGLDAVSIGPEIRGAHSVDERAQVSTVQPCYRLVLSILDKLAMVS